MASGFTLLEVLIAIAIAALLVCTAAASLMTALRAEESAQWMQDGRLALATMTCRQFLGLETTGTLSVAGQEWNVRAADVKVTEPQTNLWRVYVLSPAPRPSMTVAVSFYP